jgi:hypothetical protein
VSIYLLLVERVENYLQEGGNLLIVGSKTPVIFARELGIQSADQLDEKDYFVSAANRIGSIQIFTMAAITEAREKIISSSAGSVGKGKIAAIYFNAGKAYSDYKTFVIRDFINETVRQLNPEKVIEVSGSHLVHVAVNKLGGKTYINLINVAGESTNQAAIGYDEVPALTNLLVTIKGRPIKFNSLKEKNWNLTTPTIRQLLSFHVSKYIQFWK